MANNTEAYIHIPILHDLIILLFLLLHFLVKSSSLWCNISGQLHIADLFWKLTIITITIYCNLTHTEPKTSDKKPAEVVIIAA